MRIFESVHSRTRPDPHFVKLMVVQEAAQVLSQRAFPPIQALTVMEIFLDKRVAERSDWNELLFCELPRVSLFCYFSRGGIEECELI